MWILVRKRNAGVFSAAEFAQALVDFTVEIVGATNVTKASVTSRFVTSSFPLIAAHSTNSTDALVLKSALAIARKLRKAGDELALVASDQRLVRAAQAEAMVTLNPESLDNAALAGLMAP
jgi:hypothetical protein